MTTPYTPGGEIAVPIDLTALAIGTRLRTRDGGGARLLANDVRGIAPCVIAVDLGGDNEQLHNVDAGGLVSEGSEHPHDIIGAERPKHRVRVQVWKRRTGPYVITAYHESERFFASGAIPSGEDLVADAIIEVEERLPGNADIHPDMCMECLDEQGQVDAPNGRWACRACADTMSPTPSPAHPGVRHDD